MIKKIRYIKNFGVFRDFDWDKSLRNPDNSVAPACPINIIYGRNYSGKTTLSRLFQGLETGKISEKYGSPEFQIDFSDGSFIRSSNLQSNGLQFRAFNDEFVKRNLGFVSSENEGIVPFAVLGEDNKRIEEEIAEIERSLGVERPIPTGEYAAYEELVEAHRLAKQELQQAESTLNEKLKDKANKPQTGIKHNKIYGDANYNVPKLQADIQTIQSSSRTQLDEAEVQRLRLLLNESAKPDIPPLPSFSSKIEGLRVKATELLKQEIRLSSPLQELLDNSILENWVRDGRKIHEGHRDSCAFCGSQIDPGLWNKLSGHFDGEVESLRSKIQTLIREIDLETDRVSKVPAFNKDLFYAAYDQKLNEVQLRQAKFFDEYRVALNLTKQALNQRAEKIHSPIDGEIAFMISEDIAAIEGDYNELRVAANANTSQLSRKQSDARVSLRLNEIVVFVDQINYSNEMSRITLLKGIEAEKDALKKSKYAEIENLKRNAAELRLQMKNETKGVERINSYLSGYFGHNFLSLNAYKEAEGYRFEVIRNGAPAFHLSEGECGLIAFCYFMAKLDDTETKGSKPYIWIDDPISSLDSNHIFFVFSIIRAELLKKRDYSQVFISTHNLDFLGYLKRLSADTGRGSSVEIRYLMIEREGEESHLKMMPKYLKEHVTEFNYLFHQIHKCANVSQAASESDFEVFYNFGNNARKFLEMLLYYKYPVHTKDDQWKLEKYFGNDTANAALVARMNHELSHLNGTFERGMNPIEIPEMKKVASFILSKIKENDPDQFSALLESIGATQVGS